MLTRLEARNVVLIEHLCFEPGPGLTVITGETGAGKSVLIDCLAFALGRRADGRMIRQGQARAQVAATYTPTPASMALLTALLTQQGLEVEEDHLILRRDLHADGKSRSFINDQPVTAALIRNLGGMLMEVHGQFASHGLLDAKTHRELLDHFAGDGDNKDDRKNGHARANLASTYKTWREAQKTYQNLQNRQADLALEIAELRRTVDALRAVDPQQGEVARLTEMRHRLSHRARISEGAREALESLTKSLESVGQAQRSLVRIESYAQSLSKARLTELDGIVEMLQGSMNELHREIDGANMMSLEEVDDRLHALRGVARAHNIPQEELHLALADKSAALEGLHGHDDDLRDAHQRAQAARSAYVTAAAVVSKERQKKAKGLAQRVHEELASLCLEGARFAAQLTPLDEHGWSHKGVESVLFEVSMNPGVALGPVHRVASGGETARLFLALQLACARASGTSLVFDELDTGISGATAAAVGRRLLALSRQRQTLAVTHSPQVAACGGDHWRLVKDRSEKVIGIEAITDSARREEIARLLAGVHITDAARAAADQLLAG